MMNTAELPFVVKICGITNTDDARVAVEAGANALGFNFYRGSPRYVTPEQARRILEAVNGEFLRVGVFVQPTQQELVEICGQVPLDVLQLHGEEAVIPDSGDCRIWRSVAPGALPAEPHPRIDAYLVDTPSARFGGSGKTFDWKLAKGRSYRIVLAGGLTSQNVKQAIEMVQPWGVDACSRLESEPGKKDAAAVREFVRAALAAKEEMARTVL